MKKGATPELSQKWWSKNKATTLSKTGLGAALTRYEVAVDDKFNFDKQLKELKGVNALVKKAVGKCNKKLHAETLAALGKYPDIIKKKAKELQAKKDADDKKKAAGGSAPLKQKVGKGVTIWKRDITQEVKKKYKGPVLKKFSGYAVALTLNDDILDVLEDEGDYATPAFMVEDAQKLCKATVDNIAKKAQIVENWLKTHPADEKKFAKQFEKIVKDEVLLLGKKVEKIPELRWKKFVAKKQQYKDYVLKAKIDVAIGTLQLAGGVLAVAGAAPTGGASLALAIVGTVRGFTALAKSFRDLSKDTEATHDGLMDDLQDLKKSYLTGKNDHVKAKKTMGAKEMAKTGLNSFVGAQLVNSIPGCESQFDLWGNKVAGLTVKGVGLSKLTVKLLDQVTALEKSLQKTAKTKDARDTLKKVRKLRGLVSKKFDAAAGVNARVKKADEMLPKVKGLLKLLKSNNPDYAKAFEKVFPVVVNVGLAVAGGGLGFKEAKTAVDLASTATGLTSDIVSEFKDQVEAYAT